MDTNDLDFVKASLEAIRPTDWVGVSEKSGVPLGTIRKIAYGEVLNPTFWTVKKLADYFRSIHELAAEPTLPADQPPATLPYTTPNGEKARESKGGPRQPIDPTKEMT